MKEEIVRDLTLTQEEYDRAMKIRNRATFSMTYDELMSLDEVNRGKPEGNDKLHITQKWLTENMNAKKTGVGYAWYQTYSDDNMFNLELVEIKVTDVEPKLKEV